MYLAVEVRGAFQQAPEVKCSSLFAAKFSFLSALIAALYPGAFWDIRDLTKRRRRRQRERQKRDRFYEKNNNSARASRFLVHFFAVAAQLRREMTKF